MLGKLENNFIKIKENEFDPGNSPQSTVISLDYHNKFTFLSRLCTVY